MIALLSFGILIFPTFSPLQTQLDGLKPAVIALVDTQGRPQATGFLISAEGKALTCAHCVEKEGLVHVQWKFGIAESR